MRKMEKIMNFEDMKELLKKVCGKIETINRKIENITPESYLSDIACYWDVYELLFLIGYRDTQFQNFDDNSSPSEGRIIFKNLAKVYKERAEHYNELANHEKTPHFTSLYNKLKIQDLIDLHNYNVIRENRVRENGRESKFV